MTFSPYDRAVSEYLVLREAGRGDDPRARDLLGQLDGFYWKRVEEAVDQAVAGSSAEAGEEALVFSPDDILLIDAGVLDLRLVARAGPDFAEHLAEELSAPPVGDVVRLSQWLSRRFQSFLTTHTLPDDRAARSLLLREAAERNEELGKARRQRNELYQRLIPLLQELPGVDRSLAEAISRGAVDDRIEELLLAGVLDGSGAEGEAARQARRYDHAVLRALQLARERSTGEEDLQLLDALGRLRSAIMRKSLVRARRARSSGGRRSGIPDESGPAPQATVEEVRRFMRRELRLVRSFINIGAREASISHSSPLLLHDGPRAAPDAAAGALQLVRELDPRLGLSSALLIAPFTGSGFFEWDHDTLVTPLTPARSVEESVVNAVGNLRLLRDARQEQGRLAARYRDAHGASFRDRFLADYRAWVLRVGRGRRDALSEQSFAFFSENIGPPAGGPVIPAELARLSPKEREALAAKLETVVARGRPDAQEQHQLAVLHWQAERLDRALALMEKAAAAAPDDGRILYSLGLLCRRRHLTGAARRAFRDCARVALHSLWGIYANEALRRLA
ncbi:MAG TPA: hypothetical protein PK280_16380 [Planctomycetota bacterium]|nr:hypothetical protein [Planctomycetota bacterium]